MTDDIRSSDPRKVEISATLAGLLLDRLQSEHKELVRESAALVADGSSGTARRRLELALRLELLEKDIGALADAMTTAQLERMKEG